MILTYTLYASSNSIMKCSKHEFMYNNLKIWEWLNLTDNNLTYLGTLFSKLNFYLFWRVWMFDDVAGKLKQTKLFSRVMDHVKCFFRSLGDLHAPCSCYFQAFCWGKCYLRSKPQLDFWSVNNETPHHYFFYRLHRFLYQSGQDTEIPTRDWFVYFLDNKEVMWIQDLAYCLQSKLLIQYISCMV